MVICHYFFDVAAGTRLDFHLERQLAFSFVDVCRSALYHTHKIFRTSNQVQQLPKKSAFESILGRLKAVKLETPVVDLIQTIHETTTGKLETDGVG